MEGVVVRRFMNVRKFKYNKLEPIAIVPNYQFLFKIIF